LLKFSSVLSGVFHQRAIVCEADADCLFYQALLAQPSVHSGPYPDVLFLYAGGKHRMATIAESLSSLGVPVDVVADIDLLRELNDLKNLLCALNAPSEPIEGAWKTVSKAIEERKPWLSAGGIKAEIHKALEHFRFIPAHIRRL
jgi:hypothetical protein